MKHIFIIIVILTLTTVSVYSKEYDPVGKYIEDGYSRLVAYKTVLEISRTYLRQREDALKVILDSGGSRGYDCPEYVDILINSLEREIVQIKLHIKALIRLKDYEYLLK